MPRSKAKYEFDLRVKVTATTDDPVWVEEAVGVLIDGLVDVHDGNLIVWLEVGEANLRGKVKS